MAGRPFVGDLCGGRNRDLSGSACAAALWAKCVAAAAEPRRMPHMDQHRIETRLPADLADRLRREAEQNMETVACRLRKVVAEHFRERPEQERAP
jgi:hypothetical protein